MKENEFEDFLATAMEELESKQAQLEREHGFGSFHRWSFDQRNGKLEMFDEVDRKVLEADVVCIGSYVSDSSSWKWAWSNDSLLPELRSRAESLKVLGDITGIDLFAAASAFSIEDESMAWELTAMCVRQLHALGAYRAPSSEKLYTYFAITAIHQLPPR